MSEELQGPGDEKATRGRCILMFGYREPTGLGAEKFLIEVSLVDTQNYPLPLIIPHPLRSIEADQRSFPFGAIFFFRKEEVWGLFLFFVFFPYASKVRGFRNGCFIYLFGLLFASYRKSFLSLSPSLPLPLSLSLLSLSLHFCYPR